MRRERSRQTGSWSAGFELCGGRRGNAGGEHDRNGKPPQSAPMNRLAPTSHVTCLALNRGDF
jgi:hypothetical protein